MCHSNTSPEVWEENCLPLCYKKYVFLLFNVELDLIRKKLRVLNHPKVYDKGTRYRLTYFCYVVKGCPLSCHMRRRVGKIEGVKVCREAPCITNLLFADDSLILMKASIHNAEALKTILDLYCKASRQLISVDKSSIFFSPNTKVEIKEQLCTTLNIMTEALNDKYLGLPAKVGMDKKNCFQYLVDRVVSRVNGWKERQLSLGGKEVLKSVAHVILSYAMSVFKIPKGVCKDIIDVISKFC